MKYIVTHTSPDWDAITSVWVLKRFLPGWDEAIVEFVPAGSRSDRVKSVKNFEEQTIVEVNGDEIIHVDTGLGPLDHHQTLDYTLCGASRSWDYVKSVREKDESSLTPAHIKAVDKMVEIVVSLDHFQEIFWPQASAYYHDFSLNALLEGIKQERPNDNDHYMSWGLSTLTSLLHAFEQRIWAEREIEENGVPFQTKHGKGIGIYTLNDSTMKIAQKMGYVIGIRKDKEKGFVAIKTQPENASSWILEKEKTGIDLTLAYEKLRKMDPDATWYLHVSKKMLLNGSSKNPGMVPTKLSLEKIIEVIKDLY